MIAALPMYDWPEVRGATDALWAFLRDRLRAAGVAAPDALDRASDHDASWLAPGLLLSQTCGYPYATQLRDAVQLVATPCYDVEGCVGADYSSVIVASKASGIASLAGLAGATAAVNSETSQSGYWALRAAIAEAQANPPRRAIRSGSHRASLAMVARGEADVAAIDAVVWALAQAHEPAAVSQLAVIGWSPRAPGLPLISSRSTSAAAMDAMRAALMEAGVDPGLASARRALHIKDFKVSTPEQYNRIIDLQQFALSRPSPELGAGVGAP